jgi:hypothetical protein
MTERVLVSLCCQFSYVVSFGDALKQYRFVVAINYPYQIVYIRFVGIHDEYDKIDELVKSYIMPLRDTVTENNLSIISKGYDLVI